MCMRRLRNRDRLVLGIILLSPCREEAGKMAVEGLNEVCQYLPCWCEGKRKAVANGEAIRKAGRKS